MSIKKLKPKERFAGLQSNDILLCKKKYKIGSQIPEKDDGKYQSELEKLEEEYTKLKYSVYCKRGEELKKKYEKDIFIKPNTECFWRIGDYGGICIITEDDYIEVSKGSPFEYLAEYFVIDDSLRLADIGSLSVTKSKGSVKKYTDSEKWENGEVEIESSYRHDEDKIRGSVDFRYKWYHNKNHDNKIPYPKQISTKMTSDKIQNVSIRTTVATEIFKYTGTDSVEDLRIDLDGYNPIKCELNNIDSVNTFRLENAHLDKFIIDGKDIEFRKCKIDELIIKKIHHSDKYHSNFNSFTSNCSFVKITLSKNIKRFDIVMDNDSYSSIPPSLSVFYDTKNETGLLLSSFNQSITFNKKQMVEMMMVMQWDDMASEFGIDIKLSANIMDMLPEPPSYNNFIFDNAEQCCIDGKCAEYKIAPMINAVQIIYGSFNFNNKTYKLFFDGEKFHTLEKNDAITGISASFKKPISKDLYTFIFDKFIAVYGEKFMEDHMFLHVKQPDSLFNMQPFTSMDYPFNEDFSIKLDVSKIDFNILPDEVSAIVKTEDGIQIVEGDVIKERFGGYKLLDGSKLVSPENYDQLKTFELNWDLHDSYYPPTIRKKKLCLETI